MKKVFIVTDNKVIYKEFRRILSAKNIKVDYFCSMPSIDMFRNEIKQGSMKEICIRDSFEELIHKYELGISCHSKQLFPALLVNSILCINIHPGLNPYNRGWFPQVFSIINGLPIGATIHVMDEYIDHGDIIIQEEIVAYAYENSLDVYNRVIEKEIDIFKNTIDTILDDSFERVTLKSEGNYNSIIDYKDLCEINLNRKVTMKEAINYLRAMTHPPYKNCFFIDDDGNKIFISVVLEKSK